MSKNKLSGMKNLKSDERHRIKNSLKKCLIIAFTEDYKMCDDNEKGIH